MKRRSLLQGCAFLALALSLAGCNDKPAPDANTGGTGATTGKDSTAPGTTTPTPAKSSDPALPGAGTTGTYKVITNGISPFWDSMGKGLDEAKADLKVKADWSAPNPAEHNAQVKVFNDALSSKVDGIAISPIEADAISPILDKAIAEGTPVICFDSDATKSKRLCYIGTNNFEAGRAAGTEAVKLFPNGGKLIAFVGNMGAQNARDRYEGFKKALEGTKVEFLAVPFEDNKDKSKARKNVEDAITKYQSKGLNGLVGLYSYNGPAIVGAVEAAGISRDKMKVICFDGEPETLKNLGANKVDVTVVQKPYEFGRLSVAILNLIKKHAAEKDKAIDGALQELKPELDRQGMKLDSEKRNIDTGVDVITPANAQEFLKKLKEKGLEST